MLIDAQGILDSQVLVFNRLKASETGSDEDVYRAVQLTGCWREMRHRSTDNSGSETRPAELRVQIPDDGDFAEPGEFAELLKAGNLGNRWTVRDGDYVALGTLTDSGAALKDGFALPYEVTDFFVINASTDGSVRPSETFSAKAVLKAMREHGGYAIGDWRDCRRDVSVPGAVGKYASCIHLEA